MAATLTPQQASVWHRRIERAYRARKDTAQMWAKMHDYYRGNFFTEKANQDRVAPNLMLATLRQMASMLYFQNPNLYFKPLSPKGEMAAPIAEQLAAIELRVIDAEHQYRKAVLHGLTYGIGVLKHGYNAQHGVQSPTAAKNTKRAGEADGSFADDKIVYNAVFTERNPNIQFGHTWVRCIEPWRYLRDPDAPRQEDARWEAHIFDRPWVDCQMDERWTKSVREKIQPTSRSKWFEEDRVDGKDWRSDASALDSSMVSCCEIYDRENMMVITLVDSLDEPVMVTEYPFFDRYGPYEILEFLEDDGSPWGLSYADTFSDQILAIAKLRTAMFDHLMRNGGSKLAYNKASGLDDAQVRMWANAFNGVVGLNVAGDQNIQDLLHAFPQQPINADAYKLLEQFEQDHRNVSGQSEISLGGGSGGTATEASLIQQQAGLRVGDMRYLVERMIRRSIKRIMSLLGQFWTGQQVIPLLGPDGQAWDYVKVDRDLLQSEYDIDIESGSTERVDKAVRARQTIDAVAQLLSVVPMMNAQGYDVNWPELLRIYLRNTDVVRSPDRIIFQIQQPQPMQPLGMPGQGMAMGALGGQPQLPPNVTPFPAQQAQGMQSQMPAPQMVNNMQQMPTETDPFQMGRMFSEASFARGV